MCRTGTSGEGMPQDHGRGRQVDRRARVRAMLLRAALGMAFVGLVVGLDTSAAQAGDDDTNASAWSKFMQTLGLKKGPNAVSDVDVTERSPLVVPPTRDLPPPVADAAVPAPDWPKDPKVKPRKHHKADVVLAAPNGTAVQTVAPPPYQKKAWYNPATWFNKEEYATFTGEPARDSLTDPPAGYRTPSPTEPYGIGPDKKTKPKTANATATPPATQAAPSAAPQPVAPSAAPQPLTPAATQPAPTGK